MREKINIISNRANTKTRMLTYLANGLPLIDLDSDDMRLYYLDPKMKVCSLHWEMAGNVRKCTFSKTSSRELNRLMDRWADISLDHGINALQDIETYLSMVMVSTNIVNRRWDLDNMAKIAHGLFELVSPHKYYPKLIYPIDFHGVSLQVFY